MLNKQFDKRALDVQDVELFDELIDDDVVGERLIEAAPVAFDRQPDDVVLIGADEEPKGRGVMLPGVEPIQVDNDLSLEYTFITDVRKTKLVH